MAGNVLVSSAVFFVSAVLAGCSLGNGGLTTGSLASNNAAGAGAVPAATASADPVTRALHVGSFMARAQKCGYNFDAAKMKSDFFASQTAAGLPAAELPKIEKAYATGYNGVAKAVSKASEYCTAQRTKSIKNELTKYLAGDFSAPKKAKVAKVKQQDGIFSIFDGDVVDDKGPAWGSGDWWSKQETDMGG